MANYTTATETLRSQPALPVNNVGATNYSQAPIMAVHNLSGTAIESLDRIMGIQEIEVPNMFNLVIASGGFGN
jgi:hypothetical protein